MLVFVVPLIREWYWGVVAGAGVAAVLLFMGIAWAAVGENTLFLAADICCVAGIPPFLYGVAEKLIHGADFRVTGGMLNANYYGAMLEFSILLCIWRLTFEKQRRGRYIALAAMNLTGLFLCDCESAWLALIGGVFTLLILLGKKKAALRFCGVAFFFLLLGAVLPGILPRLDRLPQTAATRFTIWQTALRGIGEYPFFGQGTLSYLVTYPHYGGYPTYHAHSIYLDVLLNFGISGALLLLGGFGAVFRRIIQNRKGPVHRKNAALPLAMAVAVLLHGFTDATILWIQTGGLFCVFLGMSAFSSVSEKYT